jgi:hypothetical protein
MSTHEKLTLASFFVLLILVGIKMAELLYQFGYLWSADQLLKAIREHQLLAAEQRNDTVNAVKEVKAVAQTIAESPAASSPPVVVVAAEKPWKLGDAERRGAVNVELVKPESPETQSEH